MKGKSGEKCPKCGAIANNTVIDSRIKAAYRRRTRKCRACGAKWETVEVSVEGEGTAAEKVQSIKEKASRPGWFRSPL